MIDHELKKLGEQASSYCNKKFRVYSALYSIEKILVHTPEIPDYVGKEVVAIIASYIKKELGE